MSGPKVVKIVSREELLALCEGSLAGLDVTRDEWVRVGRRNDVLTDSEINSVQIRHAAIREMLGENRFAELQRAVAAEIASLQDDMSRRLAAAASSEAAARATDRRRAQTAAAVLAALEQAECEMPDGLRLALHRASTGVHDGEDGIAKGFALLSKLPVPSLTQRQRELADALKDDGDGRGIESQFIATADSPLERSLEQVDGYIATLRGLTDDATCASFAVRAAGLAESAGDVALGAKIDSLVVDLAAAVNDARRRVDLRSRLRVLAAELIALGTDQARSASGLVSAALDGPFDALQACEASAVDRLGQLRREAAASARRRAVLEGLAGLGYEVAEQMETAWVANGRVALRQVSRPGYGVEIGGGADAARVQLRTVAFREASAAPDIDRDRDAETIWCGELAALRKRFAAEGGEIEIEQAMAVGVAPLRVVGDSRVPGNLNDSTLQGSAPPIRVERLTHE